MCSGLPLGHVEVNSYYIIIIILHFMCTIVLGKQEQCHTISLSAPVSLTMVLSPMASLYDWYIHFLIVYYNCFRYNCLCFFQSHFDFSWPPSTHTCDSWLLIFFNFFSVGLKNICQLTAGQKFPSLQWVIDKFSLITCINNCIAKWRLSAWDICELPLLAASA